MLSWLLLHGDTLVPPFLVACALVALAGVAWLWFLQGARVTAAGWVWRRWWRRRRGARGGREHSPEYEAVMQSAAWRRRRRAAIRRAGARCERCGVPLGRAADVHHVSYARLGREAAGDLEVLCASCHAQAHSR